MMAYESHSDEARQKLLNAIRRGVDRTHAQAVPIAKDLTPVVTGTAQGSIRFEPATIKDEVITGEFGSYGVDYFIYLEKGTIYRAAIRMLERAREAVMPNLMDNIRREVEP